MNKKNTVAVACKCGCGETFVPSQATMYRIANGDDVGYIRGHWLRGERNSNWLGGRFVSADGYVYLLKPSHPNALKKGYVGYVAEHRLVMSEHIGRPLLETELVHHKNENKADNRIENLAITNRTDHAGHHFMGEKNPKWKGGSKPKQCVKCGVAFIANNTANHARAKYCSQACYHS